MEQPSEMKVIYISGPYRDPRGEYYVRQNIRAAETAALVVWQHGAVALCPHKNTASFGGAFEIPDETWLHGDLELVRRCDAVWALNGWQMSQGARLEIALAQRLKLPILYTTKDLIAFLKRSRK